MPQKIKNDSGANFDKTISTPQKIENDAGWINSDKMDVGRNGDPVNLLSFK